MHLQVENIIFGYSKKQTILHGVGFEAKSGELISLIGPNGSGKTTLLKCINRIHEPRSGSIYVDGVSIDRLSQAQVAQHIGYVPQMARNYIPATVLDTVVMGRRPFIKWNISDSDVSLALETLERVGAAHLAHKDFEALSGGQKQKVLIARAMAQEPDIYLFDEPISFLDIKNQLGVMEMARDLVKQQNKIVLMVAHDLNMALRYSDEILLLKDGRIVSHGKPEAVLCEENIAKVYGVKVKMIEEELGKYMIPLHGIDK